MGVQVQVLLLLVLGGTGSCYSYGTQVGESPWSEHGGMGWDALMMTEVVVWAGIGWWWRAAAWRHGGMARPGSTPVQRLRDTVCDMTNKS